MSAPLAAPGLSEGRRPQPGLSEDLLLTCMRCGFCHAACPTYRHAQVESASPRGRIALMRAVHEGKLTLMDIAGKLDMCLGCRACETACPAGVPYGELLAESRAAVARVRPNPRRMRLGMRYLLGTPAGIRLAGWGLWLYQALGIRRLARLLNLVEALGGPGMAGVERAVPEAASPLRRLRTSRRITPAAGPRRLTAAFFRGCISDIVFYETNLNAMAVLAAAGCEVEVVPGQGCCGAVHSHAGEHELALEQARRNIAAFERGTWDCIVNTAGGCGATLKDYGRMMKDDPVWAGRAEAFSKKVRDFSELLAALPPLPLGPLEGEKLTYQDSCHLRNVQKAAAPPRSLLKAIPGATFVELPESDRCCGAAGTYAIGQFEMSDTILGVKMQHVQSTHAGTVVVSNPPCQLEMIEGAQREGLEGKIRVLHIADVLAEALRKGLKK